MKMRATTFLLLLLFSFFTINPNFLGVKIVPRTLLAPQVAVSLTGYDGDIPAFIPKKYFLMVNFEALSEFCLWMKSKIFLM